MNQEIPIGTVIRIAAETDEQKQSLQIMRVHQNVIGATGKVIGTPFRDCQMVEIGAQFWSIPICAMKVEV